MNSLSPEARRALNTARSNGDPMGRLLIHEGWFLDLMAAVGRRQDVRAASEDAEIAEIESARRRNSDEYFSSGADRRLAEAHDLCLTFTQRTLDPMWVLAWAELAPGVGQADTAP